MSQWAEEILTDLHNIGVDEGPSWKDIYKELPDFTPEQLTHLKNQLHNLQLLIRRYNKAPNGT